MVRNIFAMPEFFARMRAWQQLVNLAARKAPKLQVFGNGFTGHQIVGRCALLMNTHAEIQQAFEDYQLGRMGEIPVAVT